MHTFDAQQVAALGDELFDALRQQRMLAPLTERFDAISIEDAYRIARGEPVRSDGRYWKFCTDQKRPSLVS